MSEGAQGACFTKDLRSISLAKREKEVLTHFEQMASHGLHDQDRQEDLSNFSAWKERMLIVLEAYGLRDHAEQTLATPTDADLLRKHREAAEHAKRLILDSIKDHIVSHIEIGRASCRERVSSTV